MGERGISQMAEQFLGLCTRLKKLGYTSGSQMKLYGAVYEVLSDPVALSEKVVFLDAAEIKTGQQRRVRLPLPVVALASASKDRPAA
jgi:hypothetical protein